MRQQRTNPERQTLAPIDTPLSWMPEFQVDDANADAEGWGRQVTMNVGAALADAPVPMRRMDDEMRVARNARYHRNRLEREADEKEAAFWKLWPAMHTGL